MLWIDTTLRVIEFGKGYTLTTWDTLTVTREGKYLIGYRLARHDETIFEGEDMACGINTAIDSDEAVRSLLTFLTLREGDTDSEYFDEYTPAQLAFRDSDAEWLAQWAHEAPLRDVG